MKKIVLCVLLSMVTLCAFSQSRPTALYYNCRDYKIAYENVVDYAVVSGPISDVKSFQEKTVGYIKRGFVPYGDLLIVDGSFFQAMVKYR